MKEAYIKSILYIKTLDIHNKKEYNQLLKYCLILNSESLKYISGIRNFKQIIEIAKQKEVF